MEKGGDEEASFGNQGPRPEARTNCLYQLSFKPRSDNCFPSALEYETTRAHLL